jgi:Mg-chelatase subunit ChlD
MSLLEKLKRGHRAKAVNAPRLDRHASEHSPTDEWVLDDLKRDSNQFRERLETPIELQDGRSYEPSADIHDDLFLTAHASGESKVKESERVRPSHRFGRDVLDAFVKTDDHRGAKPYTEGDELASAIYSTAAANKFDEAMRDESVRQEIEQSQQTHEDEQRLKDIEQRIKEIRDEARDTPGGIPGPLVEEFGQLGDERNGIIDGLPIDSNGLPGGLPGPVQTAVEQAAAEGKKRVDVWGTIAGSGAAELGHVSPDEAIALTEQWMAMPDFEELCKLLGRIQRDFRAQDARNVIGGDDEIVGIELGNNLTNTLPSELARLGNPLTQRSFIRDFQDESLLQFETQGSEKVDLGPGVLCIDLSGSMGSSSGSAGYKKHTAAKAVAVGFVRLMHRKKRDAIVICFNGGVMWEHHFPKRDGIEMSQLLALAALAPSGGTDITKAVARAEKIINTLPSFKRADVLVVTDGQDSFDATDAAIAARFEKAGIRKHGVAIGHTPAKGGWLLSFCDDAISVDDLTASTGEIVHAIS